MPDTALQCRLLNIVQNLVLLVFILKYRLFNFIIILIVTVIAINSIWNGKEETSKNQDTKVDTTKQLASANNTSSNNNEATTIEKELETILSNIEGVGKVKVLITYSQSSEVVAMYNENSKNSQVEEKDSGRRC